MKAHVLQPPKNTLKLQYATCGYIHKYKIRIKHTPAYLFMCLFVYTPVKVKLTIIISQMIMS